MPSSLTIRTKATQPNSKTSEIESCKPLLNTENTVEKMVTTRGRSGDLHTDKEEVNGSNTMSGVLSSNPRKRKEATKSSKSTDVHQQTRTMPIAKRTKIITQDGDRPTSKTRMVVEIPAKSMNSLINSHKAEIAEDEGQNEAPSNELFAEALVEDLDRTSKPKTLRNGISQPSDDEGRVDLPAKKRGQSAREANINSYASNQDDEVLDRTEGTADSFAATTKHKRFGSNEPEEPAIAIAQEQVHLEEDASDSDAPEEVTNQDAAYQSRDKRNGFAKITAQK